MVPEKSSSQDNIAEQSKPPRQKIGGVFLASHLKRTQKVILEVYHNENVQQQITSVKTKLGHWQALTFVLFVVLPCFLGSIYFAFIASDRYVAGAGFAVRGMNSGGNLDIIGSFTGLASTGSTSSDSYIILKYLKSRDIVDQLQKDFELRASYSSKAADFWSRLDPSLEIERVVEYWDNMVSTSYDPTSGIITFQVEAFSATDAKRVAELVLGYTRELVNRLSEKARRDSVLYAENEVKLSEARLREALKQMRIFREQEKSIDPAASAQVQIKLLGSLEQRLLEIKARMSALSKTVNENAPSLKALRRQAEALEQQIATKNKMIGEAESGQKTALSGLLASYESLEVEKGFAQKAYASALSSLESARVEADRQQRYLAIYSVPTLPEYPLYPRRIINILLLHVIALSLWGVGILIVYSVRDHLA